MKINRYLAILFLGTMLSNSGFAQCIPDSTYSRPAIYPDTLINLDTAFPNVLYEMVMTAIVPKDTLVFGNKLPVDSIGISQFNGLPSGFTVIANTASSYWRGGTKGCVLINGTASEADAGVYPLQIQVIAVVAGMPAPYPVKGYKLIVKGGVGVQNSINSRRFIEQYPNPFSNQTVFNFYSENKNEILFEVFSLDGRKQRSEIISVSTGLNKFMFYRNDLITGLYVYRIVYNGGVYTGNFIINN